MTVNKITNAPTQKELIDKTNEIIDAKYDASNPAGYTSNVGTVTSVNNTQPDANGNVTIPTSGTVDQTYDGTSTNAQSGVAIEGELSTNYVTINTDQNITGIKTFVGDKRVKFKGSTSSSKLGFTAYDNNNREIGYLEAQGQGNASHKCRLGIYDTTNTNYDNVLGFEYYKAKGSDGVLHRYNLLCPPLYPSTTSQDLYIPISITDGTNTVTADNTGSVNINSLLPDVSGFATQTWVQNQNYLTSAALADYVTNSSLATTLTDYVTNSALNTTLDDYALLTDIPTVPTNISAFTNDSGYITSSALSGYATETWVGQQGYALASSLSTVATSGSYNDLTNKPTIPAAQVQADWNETDTTSKSYILNKPTIPSGVVVDQTYDGTSTNAQSGVAIEGVGFLKNNANDPRYALAIGTINSSARATVTYATAIGAGTEASGIYSLAIGQGATATANSAIQIGSGLNSTANTLKIGFANASHQYSLLDGTTGLIPDARISSNIARSSDIPTALSDLTVSAGSNITISGDTISATDTTYSDFTGCDSITAGTSGLVPAPSANDQDKYLKADGTWSAIAGITSSDVTTALGYTPANTDLSNLSSTGNNITDTVKDQNTVNTRLKFWSGTKAQYNAITTKDSNTIYNITDDTSIPLSILEALYPVGSIYIGTMNTCPLQTLGVGTWALVAQDRVLQGAGTRGNVGTTLNESLPNIRAIAGQGDCAFATYNETRSGAFYTTNTNSRPMQLSRESVTNTRGDLGFDASRSSSVYQDNAPVQQNAYLVNIWERTA